MDMGIATILKKLLLGRAFSAEEGRITILGKYNVSLMESQGLATLLQLTHEALGEKKFFNIFVKATTISIDSVCRSLGISPSLQNLKKFLPFMDIYGWGKFTVIDRREDRNKLQFIIKLTNSPLTEYARKHFGKRSKVCIIFRSNLYAAFRYITKKPVKVEEINCYCKGAPACTFRITVEK